MLRPLVFLLLTACVSSPPHEGDAPLGLLGPGQGPALYPQFVPPGTELAEAPWQAPNILVVVADDLGQEFLSFYPSSKDAPSTPTLDGLAAEGIVFDRAYAHPTCSPSRASMLTGRHPQQHGVGRWLTMTSNARPLQTDELTVMDVLRHSPATYTTAMAGKWHLTTADKEGEFPASYHNPLTFGFDHWRGILSNPRESLLETEKKKGYRYWEYVTEGEPWGFSEEYLTTAQADDALFYAQTLPEPWLLWVNFSAPHSPWSYPPEELYDGPREGGDRAKRNAMIEAMDVELGRFLDGIDPDVLANTHIVFLSDNGTPQPVLQHGWDDTRHKGTVYETGVRVPMVIAGPDVVQPGRTSALVQNTDLFATIATWAGVDVDEVLQMPRWASRNLDTHPLQPVLQDPEAIFTRRVAFSEWHKPQGHGPKDVHERTLVTKTHKLIRWTDGSDSLFRVQDDDLHEGEDLIHKESLPTTDQAALDMLRALMDGPYSELRENL